jgi:glycerol-3-phosphate dehydrogenase (NAD(P)+)
MRVTVLGAGAWGTTVASLVSGRHESMLWSRSGAAVEEINGAHRHERRLPGFVLPPQLRATADLQQAVSRCDVLVVGVPSASFREVLKAAAENVRPWIPVVSLSKGLESGSLLRMTQVVKEELPGHPAAALSGPNLAGEIMAGNAAASVIATEDEDVATALQQVFRRGLFRVYRNHDVIGCEIAGALKNVVAIALGMAQGLSVGNNTAGTVITRGLAEITRVGVSLGAEAATFSGLAGMGDLIATCMSPMSRNRYVGEQLGLGRSLSDILAGMSAVAEGVSTAVVLSELAARQGIELTVCGEVSRVVRGEIDAHRAYRGLEVEAGYEADPG